MNAQISFTAQRFLNLHCSIATATLLLILGMLFPLFAQTTSQPISSGPVLKGVMTEYTFIQSKIYPGTTRKYWVYVPQQYNPAKPACVYIGQDGPRPQFIETFDRLIASHQMPVTIGIFVSPGLLAAPSAKEIPRQNRSFEYNSLGDDYARFLLEELLPTIVREQKLNLSNDPNDRGIGGGSSGASAAFTAAWERPDAFRRVFSVSGAFPFSRGNCQSVWVRKYEAKPLRIFLYAGKNDMYNTSGDLWMDNERLANALAFAGYDFKYQFGEGKHMANYIEVFPEAMTWLWRDWPAPVLSGSNPPRVNDIVLPNEPWRMVGEGYQNVRAMTVSPQGEVFFADTPANKMYKVGADGKVSPFLSGAGQVCGLTTGSDGRIFGISETTGNLSAFGANGKLQTLASGIRGHSLVATRHGGFYVTVPGPFGAAESKIWYVNPTGEKKLADTGLKGATGTAISTDDWLLYVADGRSHWVYSYQVNPDGSLTNREHFHWLHVPDNADDSGVEGVAVSSNGILYAATRMGIQTADTQGHNQCILPLPSGRVTALAFGEPNFDVLYAACGDKVYARKVQVKGVHAFQPPAQPTKTGL